jgi:hypothetical protein
MAMTRYEKLNDIIEVGDKVKFKRGLVDYRFAGRRKNNYDYVETYKDADFPEYKNKIALVVSVERDRISKKTNLPVIRLSFEKIGGGPSGWYICQEEVEKVY